MIKRERSERGKIQNRCFEDNVLEDKNTHKQKKKIKKEEKKVRQKKEERKKLQLPLNC